MQGRNGEGKGMRRGRRKKKRRVKWGIGRAAKGRKDEKEARKWEMLCVGKERVCGKGRRRRE